MSLGLGQELARIERRLDALERARRLANASIDHATLPVYDKDGVLRQKIGQQDDGSYTIIDLNSPVPPVPSAPTVLPKPGVLVVTCDGTTATGAPWPLDFAHIEVHVSKVQGFTPSDATQVSTLSNTRGGSVTLALDAGTYYVGLVSVTTSGTESACSAQVQGIPAPEATGGGGGPDGIAPTGSPAVTLVPFGIGSLAASWPAITNADPVTYEVYADTAPISDTPAAGLLVAETPDLNMMLSRLANGTALAYDAPTYVRVWAKDADGAAPTPGTEASATPRKATNADVSSEFVYAGKVQSTQVETGDLNAKLAVLGGLTIGDTASRHFDINPDAGFVLTDVDGSPLVEFPTQSGGVNRFEGDLVAKGFTTTGAAQFRGYDNEISTASVLNLASGVTAPANYASIATNYAPVIAGSTSFSFGSDANSYPAYIAGTGGSPAPRGLFWTGTELLNVMRDGTSSVNFRFFDPATGATRTVAAAFKDRGGALTPTAIASHCVVGQATQIGTSIYVLYGVLKDPTVSTVDNTINLFIGQFDASTGAESAYWSFDPYSFTQSAPSTSPDYPANDLAMTGDGTYLYVAQVNPADSTVRIQKFNPTGGAPLSSVTSSTAIATSSAEAVSSLGIGSFDYGASRYAVSLGGTVHSLDVTGLVQASEQWSAPAPSVAWNGTRFVAAGLNGVQSMSTSKAAGTVWAAFTWYDSDAAGTGTHETTLGPVTSAARKSRYGVQISVTVKPNDGGGADDPNTYRIYGGEGATQPALHLLTTGATYSTQDAVDTAGVAAPATNSFGDGAAAVLQSAVGGFVARGDGTGDWPLVLNPIRDKNTTQDNRLTTLEGVTDFISDDNTNATLSRNIVIPQGSSASTYAGNTPPLLVGQRAYSHLRVAGNRIVSMSNDSTQGDLEITGNSVTLTAPEGNVKFTNPFILVGSTWHIVGQAGEPAYQNGWANPGHGTTLRFRKDANGVVWIIGRVSGGVDLSVVFQLPVGYRLVNTSQMPQVGSGGNPCRVNVNGDGTVTCAANLSWYNLDCNFPTW